MIAALAEVYPLVSSVLDYRERDSLVGSVFFVLGQCTAIMDDSMNCYFSHSDPKVISGVIVVLELFKSTADLITVMLMKSFMLLTEDVAGSNRSSWWSSPNCSKTATRYARSSTTT